MKRRIRKNSKPRAKYLKSVKEIPKFKSEDEEIEFWETHSMIDIIDKLPEVKVEISGELKKRMEEHKNKKLLTLRLDPAQIDKAKEIAIKKGMGYLTLMRHWIQQGIERELEDQVDINSSMQSLNEGIERIKEELETLKTQILLPSR
ncbi:MAG: CopG family antitoxin [Thermodesulfobacteriota bacterium]